MSDPAKSHGQSDSLPPVPGQRLDWGAAARLIARGESIEAVAASFGVPIERIQRNLERSGRFCRRIEKEQKRLVIEAANRFDGMVVQVADRVVQSASEGDAKVLLWLAERLHVGQRPFVPFQFKNPPPEGSARHALLQKLMSVDVRT